MTEAKKGFRKYWVLLHTIFVFGWTITLWDLYETILAAGDTPWRIHHGYSGLALIAVAWGIVVAYKKLK